MYIPIIIIVVVVLLLVLSLFTVEQQTVAVIQRLGKFKRLARPGLNIRIPLIERIAGRVSLRVQQLDVNVETKTLDNVFVRVLVSVQYYVLPEHVYEAFYKLVNPEQQVTSFVFDVVRARVPEINLDDVFQRKDDVADAVKTELEQVMGGFGYGILKALVTDIDPDAKVKVAMNEINAAQRLRYAAIEKGEAEKIIKVKEAEAEAESKKLQGQGIARQRMAIIEGLRESVNNFKQAIKDASAHDVMRLVMITQYFDTLKDIGSSGKNSTVLIPHGPGGFGDIEEQMRNAMLAANEADPKRGTDNSES